MAFIYNNTNSTTTGGVFNAADTIIVNAEAFVLNFGGPGARGLELNNAPYIVKVNGQVGSDGPGIDFANSTGVSTLTVGVTGEVFGFQRAVTANHAVNITNSGTLFGISDALELKGNGNYTILNNASGSILSRNSDGMYISGTGTHTIINKGELATESSLAIETQGTGIEIVTNTGKITGDIFLDLGNDSFTNLGKGVVIGNIHLGGGNDKFIGNGTGEHVFDSSGSDNINLGGGGDIYTAIRSGLLGADGNDTVDGGKGADIYDAIGSAENLRINLSGGSFTDPLNSITVQANTATDLGAGESGTDKILNFENVSTGIGSDIVYGNALANQISTGLGFDHLFGLGGNDRLDGGGQDDDIFGGGGNDTLFGGGDADNITGGAGKDVLFGGDGSTADAALDVFIFTSLSDSTPGLTTRDVIMDYEDGTDIIDVAAIGLTDFIGNEDVFGNVAGQVRAVTTGQGWVLQGDRNGDGKVDFALEVRDTTHAITWADANFDFIP